MQRYRLRFLLQEVDLSTNEVLIGRSSNCQFTLDDPMVSRKHARIVLTPHSAQLIDLASRNGLRLNGVPVEEPVDLHDGDSIGIGSQELMFLVVDAARGERRPTGQLKLCTACDIPYSRMDACCPHCGAIATEVDTLSGEPITSSGSAWTLDLLGEVIEPALKSGRAIQAERMLSRGAVDLENSIDAGHTVDVQKLERLLQCAVRLGYLTGRARWIDWAASVYRRVGLPPGDEMRRLTRPDVVPNDPDISLAARRLHRWSDSQRAIQTSN